jgi:UDP:flavonoid glycosyltransferase YjiC (YdhE family)
MKIIIYSIMPVIPPDYGGAVRVFNVAQTLSQNGVEVVLVSPRPEYAMNSIVK